MKNESFLKSGLKLKRIARERRNQGGRAGTRIRERVKFNLIKKRKTTKMR
jgi:hypothetical protein